MVPPPSPQNLSLVPTCCGKSKSLVHFIDVHLRAITGLVSNPEYSIRELRVLAENAQQASIMRARSVYWKDKQLGDNSSAVENISVHLDKAK